MAPLADMSSFPRARAGLPGCTYISSTSAAAGATGERPNRLSYGQLLIPFLQSLHGRRVIRAPITCAPPSLKFGLMRTDTFRRSQHFLSIQSWVIANDRWCHSTLCTFIERLLLLCGCTLPYNSSSRPINEHLWCIADRN